MHLGGAWRRTRVFDRGTLPAGSAIKGPAVVQQFDATTFIEPGASARVDAAGNLRIRVGETLQ